MKILLILDFCGESETEFYEVESPAAEVIANFDGEFANSECSDAYDAWWCALFDDEGDRRPMGPGYRRLGKVGLCGPFDALVHCGMLP